MDSKKRFFLSKWVFLKAREWRIWRREESWLQILESREFCKRLFIKGLVFMGGFSPQKRGKKGLKTGKILWCRSSTFRCRGGTSACRGTASAFLGSEFGVFGAEMWGGFSRIGFVIKISEWAKCHKKSYFAYILSFRWQLF